MLGILRALVLLDLIERTNATIDKLFNKEVHGKKEKSSNTLEKVIIAGGLIVGIAALIALLSNGDKK